MENLLLAALLFAALALGGIVFSLRFRHRRARSLAIEPTAILWQAPRTLEEIRRFAAAKQVAEARRQEILRRGVLANALVLSLQETGVAEHNHDEDDERPLDPSETRPQVLLRVRVEAANGAPFEVSINEFVPYARLPMLATGQRVAVRYLPDEPAAAALDPTDW